MGITEEKHKGFSIFFGEHPCKTSFFKHNSLIQNQIQKNLTHIEFKKTRIIKYFNKTLSLFPNYSMKRKLFSNKINTMTRDLNKLINQLKQDNELLEITIPVSSELEICEIADRFVKNKGPALLFTNNGTQFPVLINLFASDKRVETILNGKSPDNIRKELEDFIKTMFKSNKSIQGKLHILKQLIKASKWMPGKHRGKAPCQEVVHLQPDLSIFPILKSWPYDGGKFITLPIVHTIDLESKARNIGMYRMQIFDHASTGMHWHLHKDGASHYSKYKKANKRMPVTVTLGGDPIYTYVASAPLPPNIDEYILAGFLRNKKVKLKKCITNELEVPADSDIVIEGYVDTNEPLVKEGPFGDHTGFYSLEDFYPKFHVTCITHKKEAIFPATIVGVPPMEDAWLGKITERIFLTPIKLFISEEIEDLYMPAEGVFHNLVLVKISKSYPGVAYKIMNALWGAGQMMFTKCILVFDNETDIRNPKEVIEALISKVNFEHDILFSRGPADILEHASGKHAFSSKVGIDASRQKDKTIILVEEIEAMHTKLKKIVNTAKIKSLSLCQIPVFLVKHENFYDIAKEQDFDNIANSTNIAIIIFDENVCMDNESLLLWLVLSNIDPVLDIKILNSGTKQKSIFIINAKSKYTENNNRTKIWPNIVASDKATIDTINLKASKYELTIPSNSPSEQLLAMISNKGASINI